VRHLALSLAAAARTLIDDERVQCSGKSLPEPEINAKSRHIRIGAVVTTLLGELSHRQPHLFDELRT
jgi:hypothetical protein